MNTTYPNAFELSAFIIERTAKRMKLAFARLLSDYPKINITIDQWVIIQILDTSGPMPQMQLAEASFKDAPTITRIVDKLEKKEYLIRSQDETDRRKFIIKLTESGNNLVALISPLVDEFRSKIYQELTPHELAKLESTMLQIEKNIKVEYQT